MSLEPWEAMNIALDRIFARLDEAPRRKPVPERFCNLSEQDQRAEVARYWNRLTYQRGLIGEAICEHKLEGKIREAFEDGDLLQLGVLVDRAVREYVGNIIEMEQT